MQTSAIDSQIDRKRHDGFIKGIDPSLSLVRIMPYSSTIVYEVSAGRHYIMKMAKAYDVWDYAHLARETDILCRCSGLDGITHLVKKYPGNCLYPLTILKEFFDGKPLYASLLAPEERCAARDALHGSLRGIIEGLHERDIAGLDLGSAGNVLAAADLGSVCVCDLGSAEFRGRDTERFRRLVEKDLSDMDKYIFGL